MARFHIWLSCVAILFQLVNPYPTACPGCLETSCSVNGYCGSSLCQMCDEPKYIPISCGSGGSYCRFQPTAAPSVQTTSPTQVPTQPPSTKAPTQPPTTKAPTTEIRTCRSDAHCICKGGGSCTIKCSSYSSASYSGTCSFKDLGCPSGHPCTVLCNEESACAYSKILAASSTDVTINCNGLYACEGTEFNCGSGHCLLNCINGCKPKYAAATLKLNSAKSFQCIGDCPSDIASRTFTATPTRRPTMPTSAPTSKNGFIRVMLKYPIIGISCAVVVSVIICCVCCCKTRSKRREAAVYADDVEMMADDNTNMLSGTAMKAHKIADGD